MEVIADAIILLLWLLFFAATFLGVYDEYRRNQRKRARLSATSRLKDDDPVYIMEPSLRD